MKKFTAILVAIVLALFVVSCGGSSKDPEPTTEPTDTDEEPTDTDVEPTDTDEEPTDTDEEPTDTDTEEPKPETCKLGTDLYTIDADRYFAIKGAGTINASLDSQDASTASLVKVAYDGMEGANFQYATQLSFFDAGASQIMQMEEGVVRLTSYGDVDTTTYHVLTIALVEVPLSYLDFMKENETFELEQAPITEVVTLKWSQDQNYVKQCMYIGKLNEGKEYFIGKTKVCYENNEEFAAGETFKMSMAAEIGSDEDMLEMFSDVDSVEDLCPCFLIDDANPNGVAVDCSEVPEFNTDPTDPTEPDPTNPTEPDPTNPTTPDPTEQLTCDAEAHKELNEAGDACVCMTGYTENAETHACEADAPALTCNAEEHKELNEAGDACVCMTGYTENAETHACEAE